MFTSFGWDIALFVEFIWMIVSRWNAKLLSTHCFRLCIEKQCGSWWTNSPQIESQPFTRNRNSHITLNVDQIDWHLRNPKKTHRINSPKQVFKQNDTTVTTEAKIGLKCEHVWKLESKYKLYCMWNCVCICICIYVTSVHTKQTYVYIYIYKDSMPLCVEMTLDFRLYTQKVLQVIFRKMSQTSWTPQTHWIPWSKHV